MRKINAENTTTIKLSQAYEICRHLMGTEKLKKVRNTPLFLGPPGQGKTAIIDQLVESLNKEREEKIGKLIAKGISQEKAEKEAGAKWVVVSYRLAQCDPTDLKGVPVYQNVGGAEMCSFAPPKIFPMVGIPDSADGNNVLIFLDELPQANQTIQNLAANIIDGKVGDCTIDINRSFIVCAGNRRQDHSATYEIPRNVGNRLIRFDVKTSFDEWEPWAVKTKLVPLVIGYLKDKQTFFNEPPPEDSYVYGTPRSWHKLSDQMAYMGESWFDEDSLGLYMAQGTVGMASAIAFKQFTVSMRNNFSIDKIMDGEDVKPPTASQKDILFSLVLEATYRINSWIQEAVGNPKYSSIKSDDAVNKVNTLIELLGEKKVKGIVNMYTWLTNKEIDPAFQVLMNKYQSPLTRNHLRIALATHPSLKKAFDAYMKIHNALISK